MSINDEFDVESCDRSNLFFNFPTSGDEIKMNLSTKSKMIQYDHCQSAILAIERIRIRVWFRVRVKFRVRV